LKRHCRHLTEHGGYAHGKAGGFQPGIGLFKAEVLAFLHATSLAWERNYRHPWERCRSRVFSGCFKEWIYAALWMYLRNGFTDYRRQVPHGLFKPETGMNQETIDLYNQNR